MRPFAAVFAIAALASALVGCTAADDADNEALEDGVGAEDESELAKKLVWPNATSKANSDPWLVKNHVKITEMRPRVLAINFANAPSQRGQFDAHMAELRRAAAESTRFHGYSNENAKPFLKYQKFKNVDLGGHGTGRNSSATPLVCDIGQHFNFEYAALFSDAFTKAYDVDDPKQPGRKLSLAEMVDRGLVHEVWIHLDGEPEPYLDPAKPELGRETVACPYGGTTSEAIPNEVVESKQVWTASGQKLAGQFDAAAGNDPPPSQAGRDALSSAGRSLRVVYVNSRRGVGCAVHSMGHGFEHMALSTAVPELEAPFARFAGLDLDRSLSMPVDSLYHCQYDDSLKGCVSYADRDSMSYALPGPVTGSVDDYGGQCGNVHFPPNARNHYDYGNKQPVNSTCESFGLGGGKNGRDQRAPYTAKKVAAYEQEFGDCGGGWQIYWRQSYPGHGTKAKLDGKPMKNWWPYLFY